MNYPFADRLAEDERLVTQARLYDPLTRRLLGRAGLAEGMRVLDLGSGAGNVARLAAELVGPSGAVVGVDRDPVAVELAGRRSATDNVEFRVGDVQTLAGIEDGFDAVIGRLVLMYTADPVAALREAAARVRPGGLVCMHEADVAYLCASPQTPLWTQVHGYILRAMEKAGIEQRMGPSLYATFRAAGLRGPALLVEAVAEGGPHAPVYAWSDVVTGALPLMETVRGRHPGTGGSRHPRRPAAGRDYRQRRLRHQSADDRCLGQAPRGVRCAARHPAPGRFLYTGGWSSAASAPSPRGCGSCSTRWSTAVPTLCAPVPPPRCFRTSRRPTTSPSSPYGS